MGDDNVVVVGHDPGLVGYPDVPPFHPTAGYPEIDSRAIPTTASRNGVFDLVRGCFAKLGLDSERFGSAHWNPLGGLINPGNTVFVKLNLVVDDHFLGLPGLLGTINHGSVLRAILEYVFIALEGRGTATVADSPIKETDFEAALSRSGCRHVISHLKNERRLEVRALDLRDYTTDRDANGIMMNHRKLEGDPAGYVQFDLGERSFFHDRDVDHRRLRSTAEYYTQKCAEGHDARHHRYSISRSLIEADVLISLSKMKVHRKAGTTLSQKNMVGTTNLKEWLPHHRFGPPADGGDLYEDDAPFLHRVRETLTDRLIRSEFGRVTRSWLLSNLRLLDGLPSLKRRPHSWTEGDWHGNDTIWRTLLDLNNCVFFGDADGTITDRRKPSLAIVDGIVGGEREGPLHPHPRPAGTIIVGWHPWAVDWVGTQVMGFDPRVPPYLNRCRDPRYRLAPQIEPEEIDVRFVGQRPALQFEPPLGWEMRSK